MSESRLSRRMLHKVDNEGCETETLVSPRDYQGRVGNPGKTPSTRGRVLMVVGEVRIRGCDNPIVS